MPITAKWTFLASHARALPCIADDPEVRLRDIAASRGITERSVLDPVDDLGRFQQLRGGSPWQTPRDTSRAVSRSVVMHR